MKIRFLGIILVCLFFFSCSKEKQPQAQNQNQSGAKQKVNFTLNGFTEQISANNSSAKKLIRAHSLRASDISSSDMEVLYYFVYNSAGTLVHSIEQTKSASNFGVISDDLPAGTYAVVMVAGADSTTFTMGGNYSSVPLTESQAYYISGGYSLFWLDTFYSKFNITVGSSEINQTVTLARAVSELEFDIQDTIPPTASKIVYTYSKEYAYFDLWDAHVDSVSKTGNELEESSVYLRTVTVPVTASQIGKTNVILDQIILNTIHPLVVTLTCYDSNSKVLGTATAENVSMFVNEKTVLTGKLFSGNNNFNITVNPTWGSDTTTFNY